ncbi:MAG: TraR/DksA C4-type zinc finger protein [Woeseiaceae bacterium]|nr:TraR/DksA C4-type zinc finger protein [Woeseiaceae bacterium]
MADINHETLRLELKAKQEALTERLERIRANHRRGLDPDSKERAKELEDSDVVDALGKEATEELGLIRQTLERLDDGTYRTCRRCGGAIDRKRLAAYIYASECIACASEGERAARRG